MAQRAVNVSGIGEVVIIKRKNSSNLRLTITTDAKVRVSIPYWTPYAIGVAFAKSRADWIIQSIEKQKPSTMNPGALIGKTHRLYFKRVAGLKIDRTMVKNSVIAISSSLPFEDQAVQAIAYTACERALKIEAQALLPNRLSAIANQYSYGYRKLRIRKLTSRWGSCSNRQDITLSFFLVQLPWELIDYVILHELVHTKHLNHGRSYWQTFEQVMPNARYLRKQIKFYQPRVTPA